MLFEDSAALAGLVIAFFGILGAQLLEVPELDGAASIGISLVLAQRPPSSPARARGC